MNDIKGKIRDISAVLLGISVALILWLTVFSRETIVENPFAYSPLHSFIAFWLTIKESGITGNFLGNILMFVPVGALYPIVFAKKGISIKGTAFFGSCLSSLIELTQLMLSKGYCELDDVILNTLGTLIGYCLCKPILNKLINRGSQ